MKHTYKTLWLFAALAFGLFGGILRGHELAYCYQYDTGLYYADYSSRVLPLLCVFAAAVFLLVGVSVKKDNRSYLKKFAISRGGMALSVLAGLIILVCGAVYAVSIALSFSIYKLLLGALTAVAGMCIILAGARRKAGDEEDAARMPLLITVFWAAFMLILTFMEHPVEPILQLFAYDLLAMCASALSVYCQAADVFGKNRDKIGAFASLLAVTLLTLTVFGRALAVYFTGNTAFITDALFRMIAMCGLLLYCAQGAAAYMRMGAEEETAEEAIASETEKTEEKE